MTGWAGRTVHALVHIWEPEGSPISDTAVEFLCLSRTKIDKTRPRLPEDPAHFGCNRFFCNGARPTPMGRMSYAPSLDRLKLTMTSFDDPEGDMAFNGVQLLVDDPTFPRDRDCRPYVWTGNSSSEVVGDGSAADPHGLISLAETFNEVVELGTGLADWQHLKPGAGEAVAAPTTVARPDWPVPQDKVPLGAWLGGSGWNPLLGPDNQGEQPMPECAAGTHTFFVRFHDVSAAQLECTRLSLQFAAAGGTLSSGTINDKPLPTPPSPPAQIGRASCRERV